ncbi:MAG: response regulator, partial [Microcystis panniformis]
MDIVIIEDEIEIAHLIQQTLERESFNCHLAYNGRVGLELFYQKQPDLVILDLMLPELDGL